MATANKTAAINRLIEHYRKDAAERGKELIAQHKLWRERGQGRGAVSPLGGVAKIAETIAPLMLGAGAGKRKEKR